MASEIFDATYYRHLNGASSCFELLFIGCPIWDYYWMSDNNQVKSCRTIIVFEIAS